LFGELSILVVTELGDEVEVADRGVATGLETETNKKTYFNYPHLNKRAMKITLFVNISYFHICFILLLYDLGFLTWGF
jgi:hypothetical protein